VVTYYISEVLGSNFLRSTGYPDMCFVVILNPFRLLHSSRLYLDCFLSHPFQFIIHHSLQRSTLCCLIYKIYRRIYLPILSRAHVLFDGGNVSIEQGMRVRSDSGRFPVNSFIIEPANGASIGVPSDSLQLTRSGNMGKVYTFKSIYSGKRYARKLYSLASENECGEVICTQVFILRSDSYLYS
jgi:hypothetical protein